MAGGHRYSGAGRVRHTGAEATEWVSESCVVCKMGAGASGSVVVAVTSGEGVGSLSAQATYDGSMITSGAGTNHGGTGGDRLSVYGADLGTSR